MDGMEGSLIVLLLGGDCGGTGKIYVITSGKDARKSVRPRRTG